MSKRFGRNQRRRARETIAALEAQAKSLKIASEMNAALLTHVSEHKRQLEQEIGDAKRIAGRMSVLFDPTARRLDGPPRNEMQLFAHSAVMEDSLAYFNNTSKTVSLPVMLARVRKDDLDQAIHCEVAFDNGHWGYALTQAAVRSTPEDILVERIGRQLAMTIGQQLADVTSERGRQL